MSIIFTQYLISQKNATNIMFKLVRTLLDIIKHFCLKSKVREILRF